MNSDLPNRFWAKVDRRAAEECWPWLGMTRRGYGRFYVAKGALRSAHRISYELLVGPIPEGLELDHLCRNHSCVNPAHLEPVTHRENVLRGEGLAAKCAVKTHCSKGHPYDEANTYIEPKGKKRHCRVCVAAATRRWSKMHRDHNREYRRAWRERHAA